MSCYNMELLDVLLVTTASIYVLVLTWKTYDEQRKQSDNS